MKPMFDVDLAVFDKALGRRAVPRDICFRLEMVTPERARELLDQNVGNRPVRERRVAELARAMVDDAWDFNAAPLRLNSDDIFDDGQHRCLAIIRSGISQPMLIAYHLTPESGDTIDQNAPRTVANILHRRGVDHPNIVTMAAIAILLESPGYAVVIKRQVADYVEQHEDELMRWASWACAVSKSSPKVSSKDRLHRSHMLQAGPTGALALHMARGGVDPDLILEFFNGLALLGPQMSREVLTELPSERYESLQSLHKYFLNNGALTVPGGRGAAPLFQKYATLLHNFNYYITGKKVSLVKNVHNWGRDDRGAWILPRDWDQLPRPVEPTIDPVMSLVKAIEW